MSGGPSKFAVAAVIAALVCQPLYAVEEVHRGPALLASIDGIQPTKLQSKPKENLLDPDDQFYREFFSGNDSGIARTFQDSFRYHQEQVRFAATSWRGEFLTMGSLDTFGRAPMEQAVRDTMARDIFKARIRLAIHTFLASEKRPKVIRGSYRRLSDSIEKAKNMTLGVTEEESGPRSELRAGYDVVSDVGKLEYTSPIADAGLYHPALTGALTGSSPLLQVISLSVSPAVSEGMPRPSVGYTLFGDAVSTGLSRNFGDLSTSFVRTTPLRGDAPSRYDLRLGMSF